MFAEEKGEPIPARSIFFVDGQAYGLRLAVRSGLSDDRCAARRANQLDSALNARAVMSSTPPIPLITRYLGAASGDELAQLA